MSRKKSILSREDSTRDRKELGVFKKLQESWHDQRIVNDGERVKR